jgi:hypothetical protein
MKEFITNITNNELDSIDMYQSIYIENKEYQDYFNSPSSIEHYRLLFHISSNISDSILIDIGTLKGSSALALSVNQTNTIYSFNLSNELELNHLPSNINFVIDNVLDEKFKTIIQQSKVILLDTFHDGSFEKVFYNYLKEINYDGVLLLDDIKLNNEMIEFWDNIEKDKTDISHIGHITGTGVVYFK